MFAVAAALWIVAIGHARATPPPDREVSYTIFRNGDRIGTQRVRFETSGPNVLVHHRVEIRVRVLGIVVFHYDLTARETWDGDRFVALRSSTNRNGTPLRVVVGRNDAGALVRRTDGRPSILQSDAIPADPHWLVPMRTRMQMIEAEDGAVRRVQVSGGREVRLRVGNRIVPARRYDVRGEHTATLWYDSSGVLVRKTVVASDGSRILTVMGR